MADAKNNRLLGYLTEFVSWIPFLVVLPLAGGASLAERITELPEWSVSLVELYRTFSYPLVEMIRPDTEPWLADVGIMAVGLVALFARTIFGFFLSALAFVAVGFLAVMALRTFG